MINWEEPSMSPAGIQRLVAKIAEALGPGWKFADDRHHNPGRLELHHLDDGIELRIQIGAERVAACGVHDGVGGNFPYVYGCKEPVIRFSVTKTPERMAKEITRRLLPRVRDDAAILEAARAERDARLTGRLETLQRAREQLDGDLFWDEHGTVTTSAEFEEAWSSFRAETPHVEIRLGDYGRSDHMDRVCVRQLCHEQVLVLVDTVARLKAASEAA